MMLKNNRNFIFRNMLFIIPALLIPAAFSVVCFLENAPAVSDVSSLFPAFCILSGMHPVTVFLIILLFTFSLFFQKKVLQFTDSIFRWDILRYIMLFLFIYSAGSYCHFRDAFYASAIIPDPSFTAALKNDIRPGAVAGAVFFSLARFLLLDRLFSMRILVFMLSVASIQKTHQIISTFIPSMPHRKTAVIMIPFACAGFIHTVLSPDPVMSMNVLLSLMLLKSFLSRNIFTSLMNFVLLSLNTPAGILFALLPFHLILSSSSSKHKKFLHFSLYSGAFIFLLHFHGILILLSAVFKSLSYHTPLPFIKPGIFFLSLIPETISGKENLVFMLNIFWLFLPGIFPLLIAKGFFRISNDKMSTFTVWSPVLFCLFLTAFIRSGQLWAFLFHEFTLYSAISGLLHSSFRPAAGSYQRHIYFFLMLSVVNISGTLNHRLSDVWFSENSGLEKTTGKMFMTRAEAEMYISKTTDDRIRYCAFSSLTAKSAIIRRSCLLALFSSPAFVPGLMETARSFSSFPPSRIEFLTFLEICAEASELEGFDRLCIILNRHVKNCSSQVSWPKFGYIRSYLDFSGAYAPFSTVSSLLLFNQSEFDPEIRACLWKNINLISWRNSLK